jgi:RimJ/RimL family protein N-acetyltransferase
MIRERLATEIANEAAIGLQYWPVFLGSGDFVGCCGLRSRTPDKRIYELGFYLRFDHWGKGLAREAALAVIAHAFGPVGATALYAGHHPDNETSRVVLEKLGFRYTHHELYPPTGLDEPCYELTAEQWSNRDG